MKLISTFVAILSVLIAIAGGCILHSMTKIDVIAAGTYYALATGAVMSTVAFLLCVWVLVLLGQVTKFKDLAHKAQHENTEFVDDLIQQNRRQQFTIAELMRKQNMQKLEAYYKSNILKGGN